MKNSYKPLIVALFLTGAALTAAFWRSPQADTVEVKSILSNSAHSAQLTQLVGVAQGAEINDSAALVQDESVNLAMNSAALDADNQLPIEQVSIMTNGAIQDPGQPIGPAFDPSQQITYVVKKGDTLSSIASQFNISIADILGANPSLHKKTVRLGESITIPAINNTNSAAASAATDLPNYNSDFIMPAQGYDYDSLDNNNGVEIANSCGTPVVAAADGIVVQDPNIADDLNGWNGGYGNFVLIEHGFGNEIYTRYAHLQQITVSMGDYVKQGQEIGLMGQSGGVSNCELDFEVIGAQNPFGR